MMWPTPHDYSKGYYNDKYHTLYEGAHILDCLCWLLDNQPTRVYMTGDPYKNNILVLDFPGGSRAAFMLGALGRYLQKGQALNFSFRQPTPTPTKTRTTAVTVC